MKAFDKRKTAFEKEFFNKEENKFRLLSRKRKLLGMWAADKMSFDENASLKYAIKTVEFGVINSSEDALVEKILQDFEKNNISISEEEIKEQISECLAQAQEEIFEEEH